MNDVPKQPHHRRFHKPQIELMPAMVNVVAMGFVGLVAYNGLLKIPKVGPAVQKFRNATHQPFNWIGGKDFAESRYSKDLGDAGLSFIIDAVVSTTMILLVGRTKWGRQAYDATMEFTQTQSNNLGNLGKQLFGHGPSPAA